MNNSFLDKIQVLSTEEKIALVSGDGFWRSKAMPKAGIPSIMITDGPHGLRKELERDSHIGAGQSHPSTCFPTAAAMACSWNRKLLFELGEALGEECLAEGVAVLLGPGINIKRSPLCGRNFEYFSEDPYLTGQLASAFVKGLQSRGIGASLKHFAANNQESWRLLTDSIVDQRTLKEIYLPAFETVVKEACPATVMCSYNKLNGVYASEDSWLLDTVLRKEWGYKGLVVSDWGAVNDRIAGIKAGMDLEMPGNKGANDNLLMAALANRELGKSELDKCAARVARLALSAPQSAPQSAMQEQTSACKLEAHHAIAKRAAEESIVLLKNDNNCLPLKPSLKVAVIGPFAKEPRYQGAGSSLVNPTRLDRAYDFLAQTCGQALPYAAGFLLDSDLADEALEAKALELAMGSDVSLVFAGLPSIKEAEGFDRTDMKLPSNQDRLIALLGEQAKKTGKKLAVILSNGSPVEMPWLEKVDALLESYLAGQAGGSALAAILYGEISPSGKLAETFPVSLADNPSYPYFPGDIEQSLYKEGIFVGYRYYDTAKVEPLFPFGHGLSYTRFEYSALELSSSKIKAGELLKLGCIVKNTGQLAGAEVVQLYVHDEESSMPRPEQELKGFEKLFLKPGEEKKLQFELDARAFAFYERSGWKTETGNFEIRIGASSRDIRLKAKLYIDGDSMAEPPEELKSLLAPYYSAKVAGPYRVQDSGFEALLGRKLPEKQARRPYNLNSAICELKSSFAGRIIVGIIERFFVKVPKHDKASALMVIRSFGEMPVRTLVLMGEGKLGWKHARFILNLCNKSLLKGSAMPSAATKQ